MSSINLTQHSLNLASGLARLQAPVESVTARISSGKRIDRPSADIAGVGQAAKLDAQQSRLRSVEVNLQNGVSRLQITSGQIGQIGRIVERLSELAVLSGDAVQGAGDRALYQTEFTGLQDQLRQMIGGSTAEIGGTAGVTDPAGLFNDTELFGPDAGDTFSIGLHEDDRLAMPVVNFRTGALSDLIRQDAAGAYTASLATAGIGATLKAATNQTADANALVGSVQSRLDFAANVVMTAGANNEAALSVIRDSDLAADTTQKARLQILSDSRNAMLAQARDSRANLLNLLSRH